MEKILETYLRRLTNLSGHNRSLLLLRLLSDQFLDLHDLNFANNAPSFEIIKNLIEQKSSIKISDVVDPRDTLSNSISQKLHKIQRVENFIFQERGAKDLYIGWPFVRGLFSDGTPVRCPLIFFPVSLAQRDNGWYLEQRNEVNITFNKSFLLGYAYYNNLTLDENLIETVLSDLDQDSTVYRTQLYELLKESKLEINFNQENFMDELHTFQQFTKEEFMDRHKPGSLKLFPEAVLGIFPQAGSYLVPDYVKLIEQKEDQDLESFFAKRVRKNPEASTNIRFSDRVKEETTYTPFAIDASQERALNLIKNGNSLVVQGPPGTGKSQLICNLISDFIARGKNVLLVCQKRAALDVVYSRMQQHNLTDFVGLVHDFKNDRKEIFDQIARQVDSVNDYRQKNNGLDAIQLERNFLQASRRIDQISEELEEFKMALFDDKECGKSIKELYLTSDPDEPSIQMNQQYREFTYNNLPDFNSRLVRYLDYHKRFEQIPHFFSEGPSYAQMSTQDFIQIKEIIAGLVPYHQKLQAESLKFASDAMDFDTCLHFIQHRDELEQLIKNLDQETVFRYFSNMLDQDPKEDPLWLSNLERIMMQCFKGVGPEISLPAKDLGRFQESLERAIRARKGLFSWLRWKLFSKDKIFITRILVANELKSDKEGFEVLLKRIDNRLNFEHILSRVQTTSWLNDFPENFRKIDIQNWFFYQKLALKCVQLTREIRSLNQFVSLKEINREVAIQKLKQLTGFLDTIPVQLSLWSRYLSEPQIRRVMLGKEDPEALIKQINQDFDALVEYHKIKEELTGAEQKVIQELLDYAPDQNNDIVRLLENSLALAWIDHIEIKYPMLRAVSSFKLDHLSKELQQSVDDKMDISQQILLLKSRERTYEDLEYNRLNNLVTYKDLYHQVTKKKQVWPIRRVLSSFSEEIFSLLPCWMVSPEAASAIFPMSECFDLVIFDEASQCFAERGIPAMYRGRQMVVVGDDKQLQPNDLYKVRWEDETDGEIPELDIDALLGLAKRYLPEVSLRGHYRSQSLELIEFSNIHFYGGKLRLLPDFEILKKNQQAIHYVHVAGVWEKNQNVREALEVVRIVEELIQTKPTKSLGVVTFNAVQQGLILDLLEASELEKGIKIPAGIFVKNIENVQGDERDIIIFSPAYAPDSKGKIQLKFGSLNQVGGENRLNVAITRARETIYMVTSLNPVQLDTSKTAHDGPKLFKLYLQYALDVSEKNWKPNPFDDNSQPVNWYLRKQLESNNSEQKTIKELPFADLTVKGKGHYQGLIMTDDDLYFDTLSAKEAHCYRQNHFLQKNWPFIQFYSREYWINRNQTGEKLEKFLFRVDD